MTITQGRLHNFSCEVRGTIPQATIHWYLGEELQQTDDSTTSGGENELINTTGSWSIKPIKHHDKELKCTASTPQLRDPPPAIQIKLYDKHTCTIQPISTVQSTAVKGSGHYW